MGKNKKKNKNKKKLFELPSDIKQIIWGILMIMFSLLIGLSFFKKAGVGGVYFMKGATFFIGDAVFLLPLVLITGGVILLATREQEENLFNRAARAFWPVITAVLLLILGITGILGIIDVEEKKGGIVGFFLGWPLLEFFGLWAVAIIFSAGILIGIIIFFRFLGSSFKKKKPAVDQQTGVASPEKEEKPASVKEEPQKTSIIRKIFAPRFKVKEVPPFEAKESKEDQTLGSVKIEAKTIKDKDKKVFSYQPPPLDLLLDDKGAPNSGDTKISSAIIKKTFQNFGIDVTMSEINIGPTVTQYTLKPAEGIKLSKITGLSNDLALSLAAHPIRIEAPIPGRSLVGIEVPNKGRAEVRLKNLAENGNFQKSPMNLILALGRDVSGTPVYADLTKMPHLLVAGATGTGKTIFLNSLICSLLYQPSTSTKSAGPETLRFVMVDPKRVEFPVYNNLPHLLCPVIYNAHQTVNALRWLTQEMERRFEVLAHARNRDIGSFNERAINQGEDPLPYIVVIIDELADLMAAKGREIEAGIVRLAQMARAVGIHLVVATQRPSVEVITGLIKANITSRITFQVASQVDSRTIIDTSGAEKLLGYGDLLYISSQTPKPKRIQGALVSDKEVRRVAKHIEDSSQSLEFGMDDSLVGELDRGLEDGAPISFHGENNGDEEPLYDEAKKVVIESRRASASLLQRRLRIGYARAARLIDILEEKGVVGPGEGARPREVFGEQAEGIVEAETMQDSTDDINDNKNNGEWEKV